MCCPGCQAVAQAIVNAGLDEYYRQRSDKNLRPDEVVPAALRELEVYDHPTLQRSFVRTVDATTREATLILEGIVCAACVWLNERHVGALDGVLAFQVNYATQRAQVRWDPERIKLSDILAAITAIGYRAYPFDPGRQADLRQREQRRGLLRLAVAGVGMTQVMMFAVALYAGAFHGMAPTIEQLLRWVSLLIATPVVLFAAQPFFTAAWRDLRRRQLGMDVPVALAIGAALSASVWATVTGTGEVYFDSATMFTFFLLVGRFLEMQARHKAGEALDRLMHLLPATAQRWQGERLETVPVSELAPGDRVLVRPGETVPADGEIVLGTSSVDEALLTGESLPCDKQSGDALIAGSVNVANPVTLTIQRIGEDTVLAGIVRLLERAQNERPHIARLADRIAGRFVAAILLLAGGVFTAWWYSAPGDAFWITLSVLVVTCPCALSLATPAALAAATGSLSRAGVLTTRGHALETLARTTDWVFDKTGTLTQGQLDLTAVTPYPDRHDGAWQSQPILAIAAALEQGSAHAIAEAIRRATPPTDWQATQIETVAGQGIEGRIAGQYYRLGNWQYVNSLFAGRIAEPEGSTTAGPMVWLADQHGPIAQLVFADRLRAEAQSVLQELHQQGLRLHLLSGDHTAAVNAVAGQLPLVTARAQQMPGDKLAYVSQLQAQGRIVAMVGDGVNDAPVLAGANVSLAMGQGTPLAQGSADMVLLHDDLRQLPLASTTARRSMLVIRQNLAWALGYNLLAVPAAALGYVPPWLAAIGMSASSLLVVLNALRLRELGTHQVGAASEQPAAATGG